MKKISIMLAALTILSVSALCPASPIAPVVTTTAEAETFTMAQVNADGVRIRKTASEKGTVLGLAYKGSNYEVVGYKGNWTKVKYKSGTAYIATKYLTEHTCYR